jgi:hypothetical protein
LKNHIHQRIKLALAILALVVVVVYSWQYRSPASGPSAGSITLGQPRGLDPNFDLKGEEARLAAHLVAPSPPTPTDPSTCLSLVSYKGTMDENSTVITGSVKNACDRHYRYVQITFKLFDASGAVVGTALANQSSLDAGETWKFKAHGFISAPKFRLDRITAF